MSMNDSFRRIIRSSLLGILLSLSLAAQAENFGTFGQSFTAIESGDLFKWTGTVNYGRFDGIPPEPNNNPHIYQIDTNVYVTQSIDLPSNVVTLNTLGFVGLFIDNIQIKLNGVEVPQISNLMNGDYSLFKFNLSSITPTPTLSLEMSIRGDATWDWGIATLTDSLLFPNAVIHTDSTIYSVDWGDFISEPIFRTEKAYSSRIAESPLLFDISYVAAPVPEPETYAMMLAGLGLLGVMARRRKQKLNA